MTPLALHTYECTHTASHWGLTRVYDFCRGVSFNMPWGVGDWIFVCGAIAVAASLSIFLLLLSASILRDLRRR